MSARYMTQLTLVGNEATPVLSTRVRTSPILESVECRAQRSKPEGVAERRPTMNRFESSYRSSESGVFCMEPTKKSNANTASDDQARWLKQLRELPDVRLKKVMKIREQISKGTYETEAKWKVALERLMEDLGR